MRDLIVSVKRGLNVRRTPLIEDGNVVGVLVYGQHFHAEYLRRIPPYTWAFNKIGECIVAANGKNAWVSEQGRPLTPLG